MATLALTSGGICDRIEAVTKVTDVDDALGHLQPGYRRFLTGQYPDEPGRIHPWSFLQPITAALTLGAAVTATKATGLDTGKVTVTDPAAGIFDPSMIGQIMTVTDVSDVTITSYESPTVVWTDGTAAFADKAVSVAHTGVYDLPAGFGGLDVPFQYPRSSSADYPYLNEATPEEVAAVWADENITGDYPYVFAVAALPFVTATGQRYSAWFGPVVATTVRMTYRYIVIPDELADDGNYPLGGWVHAETLIALALAHWEDSSGTGPGIYASRAQAAMLNSIAIDKRLLQSSGVSRLNNTGPRRT